MNALPELALDKPNSSHKADAAADTVQTFDGVVCFGGEDWWYHNRGHYDMQMMREASASMPVLYVNSIGMRTPRISEGRMFLKRVFRKLRSLRRGYTQVRERFAVFSPFVAPGPIGMRLTQWLLPWQIRRAARRAGIRRPLVWVACPPAADIVDRLRPAALIYQRTDRFEDYTSVDVEHIRRCDRTMKDGADVTLFCSRLLYEQEADGCSNAMYIDHGVDAEQFERAGVSAEEPADIASIPHPRVGFVGGIDASTFDPDLFVNVVQSLPEVQFILVGACSLPEGWLDAPNAHLLGQRDYGMVASYMAACDVLIMPWNRSEWIKACNPVKLKEYLAIGRPIVSTSFPELTRYDGLVAVADGAEAFSAAIRDAIEQDFDPAAGRERVRRQTWSAKFDEVTEALQSRAAHSGRESTHE